jgi:hypothetical protein
LNPQLAGLATISGTYVFDIRSSVKALRINRFLWQLRSPEHRENFLRSPARTFESAQLTDFERRLIEDRDWLGLTRYGVNFFVLEKLARALRLSNLEVYAGMRGESLEAFMLTRQVPNAR